VGKGEKNPHRVGGSEERKIGCGVMEKEDWGYGLFSCGGWRRGIIEGAGEKD